MSECCNKLRFYVRECGQKINFTFDLAYHIVGGDIYTGEYVVIPKAYIEQTLPTAEKTMQKDVVVTEIPYETTSNEYGTTATIAS